jgi:hypothetical protein
MLEIFQTPRRECGNRYCKKLQTPLLASECEKTERDLNNLVTKILRKTKVMSPTNLDPITESGINLTKNEAIQLRTLRSKLAKYSEYKQLILAT